MTNKKAGLSLVEFLIASFVLSMGLSWAFTTLVRTQYMGRAARDHYVASSIANNRLERMRSFSIGELPMMNETNILVDGQGNEDPEGSFMRSTSVSMTPSGMALARVQVEIRSADNGLFEKNNYESVSTKLVAIK